MEAQQQASLGMNVDLACVGLVLLFLFKVFGKTFSKADYSHGNETWNR